MRGVGKLTWVDAATFAGMLAAAAGVVIWGVRLFEPAASPAAVTSQPEPVPLPADPVAGTSAGWFGSGAIRMDVKLTGLIRTEERAVAVIQVNGRAPQAYLVGDALARDVSLTAIERDGVVVERAGEAMRVAAPPVAPPPTYGIVRVPRHQALPQ